MCRFPLFSTRSPQNTITTHPSRVSAAFLAPCLPPFPRTSWLLLCSETFRISTIPFVPFPFYYFFFLFSSLIIFLGSYIPSVLYCKQDSNKNEKIIKQKQSGKAAGNKQSRKAEVLPKHENTRYFSFLSLCQWEFSGREDQ